MATTSTGRDVAQFIRDQHQEIRGLFSQVTGDDDDGRRDAFERLVRLLAVHETAEEMVIYPVIRSEPGGDEVADARAAEESEAKKMLSELEREGVDGDGFAPRFAVFRDAVLRHAASEEATVLPLLEQTQNQETLGRLAGAVAAVEKLAPTHPHPHGPDSALGNVAVGPFAAIVDRTRDALRALTR